MNTNPKLNDKYAEQYNVMQKYHNESEFYHYNDNDDGYVRLEGEKDLLVLDKDVNIMTSVDELYNYNTENFIKSANPTKSKFEVDFEKQEQQQYTENNFLIADIDINKPLILSEKDLQESLIRREPKYGEIGLRLAENTNINKTINK